MSSWKRKKNFNMEYQRQKIMRQMQIKKQKQLLEQYEILKDIENKFHEKENIRTKDSIENSIENNTKEIAKTNVKKISISKTKKSQKRNIFITIKKKI
jgi:hypothetical protein